MRSLHDKRHLLAKLRIVGSENWSDDPKRKNSVNLKLVKEFKIVPFKEKQKLHVSRYSKISTGVKNINFSISGNKV